MYPAYQAHADLLWPLRAAAKLSLAALQDPWLAQAGGLPARQWKAASSVFELAQVTHARPPWQIDEVKVRNESWPVSEETVMTTPF
ncbi:MAG: polyhydroxyalkanoate depolymerase, partial [Rubrivivax sp.]